MRNVVLVLAILVCAGACGGGGGSSSPPAGDGTVAGGATGSGDATGSGGSGGTTTSASGLLSGSVGVATDASVSGVHLDVAVGGTGLNAASVLAGDVQAFGSVIANGVIANTDSAEFTVEGAPGTQSDLRQGQQVLVLTDSDNTAIQVLYRANAKGPVSGFTLIDPLLGRSTFTVLGQTVVTDASTTFANVSVDTIADGTLLEVSGTLNDAGSLAASYVELKSALTEYKAVGVARNATPTTFTLGDLQVDYTTATLQDFDGATVTNGDVLEAQAAPTGFTAPDQLAATAVERLPLLRIGDNALARVEGIIDSLENAAEFTVQTTPVATHSGTSFVNGSAASLAQGVKVQVEGTADADGVILAGNVTIQPAGTMRVEGNVETVGPSSIRVLGVTFDVRDLTRFEDDSSAGEDPFTPADLSIGEEVEIRGYLDGGSYVATQVEREDEEVRARLRGIVTAEDAAAGTLEIAGIAIKTGGGTQFEDEDETIIGAIAFFDAVGPGDFVQATWDPFTSTGAVVDELSLEDD